MEKCINEFLSHEVRNPLSVAIAAVDLSESSSGDHNCTHNSDRHAESKGDKVQAQPSTSDLKLIKSSLEYINELLNNMLDIQKLEHDGAVELRPRLCSLRDDVLEQVRSMLAYRSGIEVTCVCEEPLWVRADSLRVKQVVMNLAKNSVKFVSTGFIRIVGKRDRKRAGIVVIAIEDSGPGIPPEQRQRLFSKFETLAQVSGQGSGLGLFLCKALVEAMNGVIFLDPNYRSGIKACPGCRFVVELPLKDMGKPQSTPHKVQPERTLSTEELSGVNFTLLLVDDDPLIRLVTSRILKQLAPHWEYLEATSGKEALERVLASKVDIVIVDHYMPGTPGWTGEETIRRMRENGVQALIIGCSANEKRAEHVQAGANAFLQKPIKAERLRETLITLIRSPALQSRLA